VPPRFSQTSVFGGEVDASEQKSEHLGKQVRLPHGKWRYCRPVVDAKDEIGPNQVIVKDDYF